MGSIEIPNPSTFTTPRDTRAPGIPYFTPSNNPGAALHPNDPSTPTLFRPLKIRDVTLKNRVIVAPMCMFSSEPDPTSPAVGALTDFHIAHLGHLATKGAALILIESTGVFARSVYRHTTSVIPAGMPLFLRISATEWLDTTVPGAEEGSWDIESSIQLARLLPEWGVDFLDVSSGGNHKDQKILPHSKYQITFAGQLRKEIKAAGQKTLVGAVGLVTEAEAARDIVQGADEEEEEPLGDAVLIGRQFLREPGWVMNAAKKVGVPVSLPLQFGRVLAS